ncbi:2-keto-4-pentenoate hydratase [Actinomadura flavalba]|uniref:2-keto-4-pentenoate hydratase n=1 Tax=Actinomadura flavalba TaxID=1120938 RepID=UPI000381C43B|nr:fumarylacetoacetate hydrolase family protein [Actinomadura flavalba]
MTMDTHQAADLLLGAYATGVPVDPFQDLTLEQAYAVQLAQVERWQRDGRTVKGHKVGLTSAAMRRQLGVDRPDYGHLLDTMFHLDAAPIDAGAFLQPRIEPEIAFVLRRDLAGPGVTAAAAAAAVDFVLPALEIIDSRIRDWKITLTDTVADNASCGGVVLGSTPTPPHGLDLALTGCLLSVDGRITDTGAGGAVLGHPLNALVWLANTLGERGVVLRAGDVVLPGSVTAAIPVAPGQAVTAAFAGLGSVTADFSGGTASRGGTA